MPEVGADRVSQPARPRASGCDGFAGSVTERGAAVTLETMKRTIGNWVALLAFTAVAVYLSWLIILPFVEVIIWAAVLAVVSYPVYVRWRARGWGPSLSAVLTTVFVVLVIVVPLALVGTMLARQVPPAIAGLQEAIPKLLDPNTRVYQWVNTHVNLDQLRDPQWLAERGKAVAAAVASRSVGLVGNLFGAVIKMFFVLFTLYYLLKDADRIVPAIRNALPLEPAQADAVFRNSSEVIAASLNGVLVISAIQGAIGGVAFWLLGLPSPLLWGVVMFLLSMIPMVGAAIVWLPAAAYLLVNGHPVKGVLLVAIGGGVIGMIDNLLRPRLVGERTRLHELIVFFSVLGGLQVFGVLGLVVGPVVVSVTMSLVEVFRQMNQPGLVEVTTAPAVPPGTGAVTVVNLPVEAAMSAGAAATAAPGVSSGTADNPPPAHRPPSSGR